MFHGVTQLVYAARLERAGCVATWIALIAGSYLGAGLWLLTAPLPVLAGLSLLFIFFFFCEGLFEATTYFLSHRSGGSFWMLLGGLITMTLTIAMWISLPSTSFWALGMVVGTSMSTTGIARLLLALALRKHPGTEVNPLFEHRAT